MRRICSIIILLLAFVCAGIGIKKYMDEYTAGHEYEQIRKEVVMDETEAISEAKAETEAVSEEVSEVKLETEDTSEEASEAKAEGISEAKLETEAVFEQESKPETETEAASENEPKPEAETEAVSEKKSNPKTETEVASGGKAETEADLESETETETEKESVVIPINFKRLQERNPDAYAWIRVDGTQINYPIVQHEEDNTFYLDHNIFRKDAIEGTIYTEDLNEKDFEDPNTIIYGHNMRNGSMFQNLHKFSDKEFFDEHRDVVIYLPDEIRHYKIFAAYMYDNRHILESFDFSDYRVIEFYQRRIFSIRDMESHIDKSMEEEFDKDSKIITLSTCYNGIAEKRYLVQAVLVSVDK